MIATANNVKALPYELYRKGRFSEVFFSGLPNDEERRSALKHYLSVSLKSEVSKDVLDELVEDTEGYSYSDLEMAIKDVAQKMLIDEEKKVTLNELFCSVKSVIPISKINPELVKEIEEWGRERAMNVSRN